MFATLLQRVGMFCDWVLAVVSEADCSSMWMATRQGNDELRRSG